MPARLRIDFADCSHVDRRVPVETWMQSGTPAITLATTKPVARLAIDPDAKLPDADRGNNGFTMH
jgi:hypothetical protein